MRIFIAISCVILGIIGAIPYENKCDRCLYKNCSSSYVLASCSSIQRSNIDKYFSEIQQFSEHNRVKLYSKMYGENMGECFFGSREYCKSIHCSNECNPESDFLGTTFEKLRPDESGLFTTFEKRIKYFFSKW